jgi:hypothetical protein
MIKSIKDILRKNIAHKHLGKDMIGAITMNEIRKYFGIEGKLICNEDGQYETISSSISSLGARETGVIHTHEHNGLLMQ